MSRSMPRRSATLKSDCTHRQVDQARTFARLEPVPSATQSPRPRAPRCGQAGHMRSMSADAAQRRVTMYRSQQFRQQVASRRTAHAGRCHRCARRPPGSPAANACVRVDLPAAPRPSTAMTGSPRARRWQPHSLNQAWWSPPASSSWPARRSAVSSPCGHLANYAIAPESPARPRRIGTHDRPPAESQIEGPAAPSPSASL